MRTYNHAIHCKLSLFNDGAKPNVGERSVITYVQLHPNEVPDSFQEYPNKKVSSWKDTNIFIFSNVPI